MSFFVRALIIVAGGVVGYAVGGNDTGWMVGVVIGALLAALITAAMKLSEEKVGTSYSDVTPGMDSGDRDSIQLSDESSRVLKQGQEIPNEIVEFFQNQGRRIVATRKSVDGHALTLDDGSVYTLRLNLQDNEGQNGEQTKD